VPVSIAGLPANTRRLREAFPLDEPPRNHPSGRDVTSWISRHPDNLTTDH
jgi:hypothetical protein